MAWSCGGADKGRQMDEAMRGVLDDTARPAFVTADAEGTALWKQTRQFYEQRAFVPVWIKDAKPRDQMEDLIEALQKVDQHGLDPELYSATLIKTRREEATKGFLTDPGFDPKEAGKLDVWLTYLYLKHAADVANGLSDLASADKRWKITPDAFDPLAHLNDAVEKDRVVEALNELQPQHREYTQLRESLATYRQIAAKGGWPTVPDTLKLKPGQTSPAVAALANRLAVTGDFTGTAPASYDTALQDAVKHFQTRHGLAAAGLIGAETIAAMNVPVEARIRQIELNLERWRWLPQNLGDRYILVNVPEMRLRVHEGGNIPLAMNVVVGTPATPTPIFNDEMQYVVLSPYWNVPDSIAQGETLPGLMKDPNYLARNNMEIVDKAGKVVSASDMDAAALDGYRFRQRPGKANSLGLVKFMFPNQYNVYLHDTPADSLFARAGRAFSHGCVRVEDPMALAKYVLKDQNEWTTEAINAAMHSGTEKSVSLTKKIPVYLGYWTSHVDEAGVLNFRADVYGIDADQGRRLTERMNRLKQAEKPVGK
jgi:murein L,D-transpeptidase YcbB/YkuD